LSRRDHDRDPAIGQLGPGEAFRRTQAKGRTSRDMRQRQSSPGCRPRVEAASCAFRKTAVTQSGPLQFNQSCNAEAFW